MYLKKINICGFKSFADRVTLTFDKGITGVVGPNGSGKSNVIDAVRWVMGEQNAKNLRGEKATDIIFAGSEKRKPLSMAEVSLNFDNSDESPFCPLEYRHESDITLTRRLYLDGQREYLINKKPCRLKDIVDFFATTGLGGRSYSMIQQGQVDRILNAKPEDVREILEEAAGTILFKKRKLEAEKKLDFTRQNLSRIDDIIIEVERQKEGLQEQAEKAKVWKQISQDLKDRELELLSQNFLHFQVELKEVQAELNNKTDQEAEHICTINELEVRLSELQGELEQSNPKLASIQEEIANLREDIARHESLLINHNTRIEGGKKRLLSILEDLDRENNRIESSEAELQEKSQSLEDARKQANAQKEVLETLTHDLELIDESARVFDTKHEELQEESSNLKRLIDSNKIRRDGQQKEIRNIQAQMDLQNQKLEIVESEVSLLSHNFQNLSTQIESNKAGVGDQIKAKHAIEIKVAETMDELREHMLARDEAKERFVELRTRHQALCEHRKEDNDLRGQILKLQQDNIDVESVCHGIFAEQIEYNEDSEILPTKAKRAFESWAEKLVVDDIDSFLELIGNIHSFETSIIPILVGEQLPKLDKKKIDQWQSQFDLVPLNSIIRLKRTHPTLKKIADSLFHLSDLSIASEFIESIPYGVTVFTGGGVVLGGGYEYTIGEKLDGTSFKKAHEIDALQEEIRAHEEALAKNQSKVDTLETAQERRKQELKDIDSVLVTQNKDMLDLMTKLEGIKSSLDHKKEQKADLVSKAEQLALQMKKTQEDHQALEDAFAGLQSELSEATAEIERLKEDFSEIGDRREELKIQKQTSEIEVVKLQERQSAYSESYNRVKANLEDLTEKIKRLYQEKSRIDQDEESAKQEIEALSKKLEATVFKREELEEELVRAQESSAGIVEEMRVIESRLKDSRQAQNKVQKMVSDKHATMERLKIAIENLVTQAKQRYDVDVAELDAEIDEEFNIDEANKVVKKLRAKIESMGPINMMAIEEFDEHANRLDFMSRQREEITSSITLLESAIEDIEESSKEKFLQSFVKTNEEFSLLFPILFPGGSAQLTLTDEANPLEGGVEIMVQLPGKKQQRMNLFSGGEKALTAISLIFALLKSKPTPFCFLDEVDAPLDEANVGRYNNVLEALSDRFQFIVITHNRRTMEVLDTLYGVTMQEGGVSKVVGVDMQKDLPAHLKKALEKDANQLSG